MPSYITMLPSGQARHYDPHSLAITNSEIGVHLRSSVAQHFLALPNALKLYNVTHPPDGRSSPVARKPLRVKRQRAEVLQTVNTTRREKLFTPRRYSFTRSSVTALAWPVPR